MVFRRTHFDFLFTQEGRLYLEREYQEKERSLHDIARERETYPHKVRRALLFHKMPVRDKSEAQKLVLSQEKADHPTKGKEHTDQTKAKISQKTTERWEQMPRKQFLELVDKARKAWRRNPLRLKEGRRLATRGRQEASRHGSLFAKRLAEGLQDLDCPALLRHELEGVPGVICDVYLPNHRVAVEVTSPCSNDHTQKFQKINGVGIRIIHVEQKIKRISMSKVRDMLLQIYSVLLSLADPVKAEEFPSIILLRSEVWPKRAR